MNINPQDPVIAMLRNLVQDYEQKLDALSEGVQEAFRMMAEGNAAAFQSVLERLTTLEAFVNRDISAAPRDQDRDSGVEL